MYDGAAFTPGLAALLNPGLEVRDALGFSPFLLCAKKGMGFAASWLCDLVPDQKERARLALQDRTNSGDSIFHLAAKLRNYALLRLLIDDYEVAGGGAKLPKNAYGECALAVLVRDLRGTDDRVLAVLQRMLTVFSPIRQDNRRNTPLDLAIRNRSTVAPIFAMLSSWREVCRAEIRERPKHYIHALVAKRQNGQNDIIVPEAGAESIFEFVTDALGCMRDEIAVIFEKEVARCQCFEAALKKWKRENLRN
jgi:hypothetical protein